MKRLFFGLFTIFIFIGCSGGGSSSSGNLFSGQFIDAKVQGLDYNCSSGMSGTTDSEGTFTCQEGDTIKFYARGIYIGSSYIERLITPYDLWVDDWKAINSAQLLQTLDIDSSNDDLIVISGSNIDGVSIESNDFEQDFLNVTGSSLVADNQAESKMKNSIVDFILDSITFDDIKAKNSDKNNIIFNLDEIVEPYSETKHGHTLSVNWSSSNRDFLSNSGAVNRPTYEQGDQDITLRLIVSFDAVSKSKDFNLTILHKPTSSEIVSLDYNALNFDSIRSTNELQSLVISNLNLIVVGDNGSTISWDSNDTSHISNSGVVTRPLSGSPDVNVTLSATVYSSSFSQIKTFVVTVKAIQPINDNDNDFIPDDIENMLGLDSSNGDENGNGIADGIDPFFRDTFYKNQWHLKARGTVVNNTANVATIIGNDLNLSSVYSKYMGYNEGAPIIISVVDNGTDADHEDLIQNMDMIRSRNAVTGTTDPSPTGDQTHGTMVAGIIAARGFNNKGVRGIAPFAKIAGNNWLSNQTYTELEKAWVTGIGANDIAVCNNSWGSEYDNDTLMEELLKVGATTLRDGKGRIYVKAAGNSRYNRGNSNLSNSSNNRYIIAVAAIKHDNTNASYSSFGSNILVSGYSGEFYNIAPTIGTTNVSGDTSLPTWSDDSNHNYTYAMNGTSAAVPTVSGCIALILEACPDLTYRDVKNIIAKTSTKIDSQNRSWVQNSSGLWHSKDYGYGLINTKDAINMCKNGYTNLPIERTSINTENFNTNIPDNDDTGVSFTIPISSNFKVEWVGVYPNITHTYQGDLEITLTSPSGVKTELVQYSNVLRSANKHYNGNGRLSSSAFIGENSNGNWIVTIKDKVALDTGKVNSIKLEVVGH